MTIWFGVHGMVYNHVVWGIWYGVYVSMLVSVSYPSESLDTFFFCPSPSILQLQAQPAAAKSFLVLNSSTQSWRAPRIGEQCCARPQLANTLEMGAHHDSK